jgi:chromosome segregation ATPase
VTDAWPAIKIREFEHVATRPTQSLLRVSGQAKRRRDPGPRPALVIDDGNAHHRFSALSAPPDRGRTLRAAYPAPTALIELARAYWLEHDDGSRTTLPRPELGVGRVAAEEAVPRSAEAAYDPETVHEKRLAELEAAHARALDEARRQTVLAESRAAEAEDRTTAAEDRARSAAEEVARLRTESDELTRRLRELHTNADAVRRQLADRDRALGEAIAAREPLERQLTEALAAKAPLERELEQLRAKRASIERELDHARDQVRLMTMERDELSRQAQAFDEVAVKARERAVQAEEAHQKSSSALQELEVWRGELERRLADATIDLGALRTARDADQRELERLRAELAQAQRPA